MGNAKDEVLDESSPTRKLELWLASECAVNPGTIPAALNTGCLIGVRRTPPRTHALQRHSAVTMHPSNSPGPGVLGKSRDIVIPLVVEVVIQKHGRKQAEFERRAGSEPLDDLPGTLVFFMGVGSHQVEVELVGVHLG